MKKFIGVWVFFLLFLSLSAQKLPVGVTLQTPDREKVILGEVVGNDLVVITFWATWCKPCQSELEALLDIQEEWKDKVRILAVSIDDSRAAAKVKSLVKGKKWPYEVLLDVNKELYKALNLTSVPYAMIVDQKGNMIYSHVGYMPGDEIVLIRKALEALK